MNKDEEIVSILGKLEGMGISCGDVLSLGHVVSTIFTATQDGKKLVVKIGLSERAAREVRMNRDSYEKMRDIGALSLLPDPNYYIEIDGVPIIIMEHCGLDFWHAVHKSSHPEDLYQSLIDGISDVYSDTSFESKNNDHYFGYLKELLTNQYQNHLNPFIEPEIMQMASDISFENINVQRLCFSSFDFTPEDVFVSSDGVRYADPIGEVIGVPIVDLACFAGVARDAHSLPGSNTGYKLLKDFAMTTVSTIVGIERNQALYFWNFGRALQSALSSRFRLDEDMGLAMKFLETSKGYLKRLS